MYLLNQIEYEGRKRLVEGPRVEDTLVDPKKDLYLAKEAQNVYIDNLVPSTVYSINMSAKFVDGSWGPPYLLRVETSSEGSFNYFYRRE